MLAKTSRGFITFVCQAPGRLCVVEASTAAVTKAAQLQLSPVARSACAYKGMSRVCTTDAAASNIAAEASIAKDRGEDSPNLHQLCTIHGTAGVYKKTFAVLDETITGVARAALSLRSPGAMVVFRRCLKEEIDSRLHINYGFPPDSCMRYKAMLMQIFAKQGTAVATRRCLLSVCPKWRVAVFTSGVLHCAREGGRVSESQVGA